MTKMKASDFIATFLRIQNTKCVFEVAGGMITHLLDSLYRIGNTQIISVHHEQTAAFAADAYGRCTGRPGVAMATSGPGATNLLTGIGSCYFDSSPALFITGQVNTYEQKGVRKIRQLGFQETDIVSIAKPITKNVYQIQRADELQSIVTEAYTLAVNGRPGPVLIDIPMDIQRAQIEIDEIKFIEREYKVDTYFHHQMNQLYTAIAAAKKPLILVGNGVNCAKATQAFVKFAELTQIPVVSSLLGMDIIPFHHPLRVGFIGSYGNRWANIAFGTCDLLIVIGSRLDIRQTGADVQAFRAHKKIFHIDCDESEINNRVKDCIPIVTDAKHFLQTANEYFVHRYASEGLYPGSQKHFRIYQSWIDNIRELTNKWPDIAELKDFTGINPNYFMHALSSHTDACTAFVVDVGNHQMWSAQSLEIRKDQAFITSGGMGSMGFALPAAIGYCIAAGKKPVMVIAGDGAFQMNIQELQTIVRNQLPIKIVVLNNQALGMIRQFQDSYFEGRYQSTYWGYSAPDFAKIATAYGLEASTISEMDEIENAVKLFCLVPEKAGILQVMVSPHMNVYPKIAFGKPITEMEPFAKPTEMECT